MGELWSMLISAAATVDETIWGDSGEEDGAHNRMILTLGFCCTHSLAVWGSVAFFGALRKWKLAEQHRITQKDPDPKIVRELFSEAIADHVVVQWLFIYFVMAPLYNRVTGLGGNFASASLPSTFTMVWQLLVCVVLEDAIFYWTHRALHHKAIYKHVHHEHHKIKINHVLASQHAHILEKLIGNSLPFWAPCMLLDVHCVTLMAWTLLQITESSEAHSGYDLPWSPFVLTRDGGRHDFHHSHAGGPEGMGTSGSYASWFEFWDKICGTDKSFKKFLATEGSKIVHPVPTIAHPKQM